MKRSIIKRSGGTLMKISLQRKSSSLKSSGSTRRKVKSPEEKKEQQDQYNADWEFYKKIWDSRWCTNERPVGWWHICESCKQQIWGELKSLYIDHILEKSVFPQLRYEPDNIAILCTDCHSSKTNGIVNSVYKNRIEKAKKEFGV